MINESNVLIAEVQIKEYPLYTNDGLYSDGTKQSLGTGYTVQGISTEIRYSTTLNGVIAGGIYLNDVTTPYSGTIVVRDCNTGQIVAQEVITNGEFTIHNLNPSLKYDVECIPADSNLYQRKTINEYNPIVGIRDIDVVLYNQSTIRTNKYEALFKVSNIHGDFSFNTNLPVGIGELTIIKLTDEFYKVEGVPTANIVTYSVIVSDMRLNTNSTKTIDILANLSLGSVDVNFGTLTSDSYGFTTVNVVGTPTVAPYANGEGLSITGSTNAITFTENSVLNVGTTEFEMIIDFKIISKLNGDYCPLITTASGTSNVAGNVAVEVVDTGLKIRYFDGLPESTSNTILVDYFFETNKEYSIKISRGNNTEFKVYINNSLEYSNQSFYSKNINFASGGKTNVGFASWQSGIYEVVFDRFQLIENASFDVYPAYKDDIVSTSVYAVYITDKITDIKSYEYDTTTGYQLVAGKLIKSTVGKPTVLKNFEGLRDLFTIEFKCAFETSLTRQYVLYNNAISIYYENNKINVSLYGELFSSNIVDLNSIVTIKKTYYDVTIIVNDVKQTFQTSTKYISIPLYIDTFILSDGANTNIFTGSVEYILFDNNVYNFDHVGKILSIKDDTNLDMAVNETSNLTLPRPSNAVGNITWSLFAGSLPSNVELTTDGIIFGAPTTESRYVFKLKCVDSIGQVGYITHNIRVGKVVSYCRFEGNNAATTMTDLAGKTWTSNSGANLSTAVKKFGTSSGYFNGSAMDWTTPQTTDFDFGRNDFTISAWVYNTGAHSNAYRTIMSKRNNWSTNAISWCLMRYNNTDNKYRFEGWNGPNAFGYPFGNVSLNVWEFVTVCRKGAFLYCSVNGVVEKFYFSWYIYDYNYATAIGQGDVSNSMNFAGYIDEVKVVKGSALYTKNFTPPTKPSDFPSNILIGSANNLTATSSNNKITITWDHDEYPTTFKYYRSTTTMNPASMPIAINDNITGQFNTRTYTDSDPTLVVGTTYYIRIGSVKNGVEKISNEIGVVVTSFKAPYNLTGEYKP